MLTKITLVIDDDPSILSAVAQFLKTKGLTAVVYTDPRLAVEWAATHRPDLILCDIMMPEIDGWAVLERLKADPQTRAIPVVMISAKDKVADVEKGLALGADAYILKPIDWNRAWAKLRAFLIS